MNIRLNSNVQRARQALTQLKYRLIGARRDESYMYRLLAESSVIKASDSTVFWHALFNTFVATGGRTQDRLTELVRNRSLSDNASSSKKNDDSLPEASRERVREIKVKGYTLIPNYLSSALCEKVINYAATEPCFPRRPDYDKRPATRARFAPPYLSARYDFHPDPALIFCNETIQNIIADPGILEIVHGYLGSMPYLDSCGLFWSVPHATRDPGWAEDYHFDFENLKWLKIFVNFEEVRLENGPHCYLEGTHKSGGIPSQILKKGYSRLTDENVFKYIDQKHEKIFLVPAGSLLIEDTRGLHKGLSPTSGRRLMLTMQYSNLLIEPPANKLIERNFRTTDAFEAMLKQYNNIAAKYFV